MIPTSVTVYTTLGEPDTFIGTSEASFSYSHSEKDTPTLDIWRGEDLFASYAPGFWRHVMLTDAVCESVNGNLRCELTIHHQGKHQNQSANKNIPARVWEDEEGLGLK